MEEMYNLCQQYLKEYSDGQYVNDAQLRIAQYWLGKKNYPEFFKIAKAFVEEYPDESPYSNDLVFLMGSTWLTNEKYDELIETFSKYSEDFEDSGISDGLLYWLGMGYMGKGDFKNAGKTFGEIAENYSISPYAEDAGYRQGVALYGIGDYPAAQKALESFIESYPKSKVRGEVEFFLGDIFANSMLVKESLEHYMNVEKYTKSQPIIDNAYTQAAKLLTSDEKYEETVKLMDSYLAKFKEGSRSEINYLKGRALEKLGLPADALNVYRKAIEEYGGNPHDDGVDKMILDYNRLYNENFDMLNATIAFIEKLMTDRELLYNMVEVPAQRYRYFMANPKIDKRIYNSFKRDTSFGPNLYNDKSNIKALLEKYKKQLQEYPQNAENYFKSLAKTAADKKNITLEYRLMRASPCRSKECSTKTTSKSRPSEPSRGLADSTKSLAVPTKPARLSTKPSIAKNTNTSSTCSSPTRNSKPARPTGTRCSPTTRESRTTSPEIPARQMRLSKRRIPICRSANTRRRKPNTKQLCARQAGGATPTPKPSTSSGKSPKNRRTPTRL